MLTGRRSSSRTLICVAATSLLIFGYSNYVIAEGMPFVSAIEAYNADVYFFASFYTYDVQTFVVYSCHLLSLWQCNI
jgi:hypothetical protein